MPLFCLGYAGLMVRMNNKIMVFQRARTLAQPWMDRSLLHVGHGDVSEH